MSGRSFSALWTPTLAPGEVVLRAVVIYVFVQLLFRITGRKEFAKWGPSDIVLLFLISVAARTSIVGDDASLTTAMVALATLIGLDWLFSWITARSERAARLLEGDPRQLIRDGVLQREQMRRTRVSESQLLAHARALGRETLSDVKDAFLERSGKITLVLRRSA